MASEKLVTRLRLPVVYGEGVAVLIEDAINNRLNRER
ncbi:hypothetical protein BAR24066_07406 [Burkholderia arboris]|uniref:Uncharacterized protein n=1 Tax=Burkholderia arboris TaxID=488730 RepID=A0A9Q9UV53_9BURK|nr:hypothetical protein BAR24066_07406 [Burkholderia arboris]